MARKTTEIMITDEGRDKGKTYVITEMGSRAAEKWASRALIALSRGAAGAVVEQINPRDGWAGIAQVGLRALSGISWPEAEPLMDEMMGCVAIKTNDNPRVVRPLTVDDDIEEVATRVRLRTEALQLHVGFSIGEFLSRLGSRATSKASSPSTQTSQDQ